MTSRLRVVADTNALVSRLLLSQSAPAQAVRKAIDEAQLLASEATLDELASVLSRPKFDRYVTIAERQAFLERLIRIVEIVPIVHTVRACRDPRDDKFLEVAVNGEGGVIITGDRDLLILNPYRDIAILTPTEYLTF